MKLEDLYLINKEEWLDVIKDKCKKRAKTDLRVSLILLILYLIMVTIAISAPSTPYSAYDNQYYVLKSFTLLLTLFLWALMSGWWVLKSHSFLKAIDGLGTPEQLLNKFKKYVKDKSIIWTIGQLIFCGWFACFLYTADSGIIFKVIGWIIILVFATESIYRLIRGKYSVASSDEDITRRLQELIGEE
jgi:hypothetical protein